MWLAEKILVHSLCFCINCIFFSPLTWAQRTACIPADTLIWNVLLHLLTSSWESYLIWALAGTCGADTCTSRRKIFLLSVVLWPLCITVTCQWHFPGGWKQGLVSGAGIFLQDLLPERLCSLLAMLCYFKEARLQPHNSSPCFMVIYLWPLVVKKKWCLEFKKYSTAFGGFLSVLSASLVSSAVSGTSGQLMHRAAHDLPCSDQIARQWPGWKRSVALISSSSSNWLVPLLLSLQRALINQACPREWQTMENSFC